MKIPSDDDIDGSIGFFKIAALVMLMVSVGSALKLFGFRRVHRALDRTGSRPEKAFDRRRQLTTARNASSILQRINRDYSLFGHSCLAESLALLWLLTRQGINARLRIGVRTLTGVFESHAWVEYDGQVLNEVENAEKIFTVFDLRSS